MSHRFYGHVIIFWWDDYARVMGQLRTENMRRSIDRILPMENKINKCNCRFSFSIGEYSIDRRQSKVMIIITHNWTVRCVGTRTIHQFIQLKLKKQQNCPQNMFKTVENHYTWEKYENDHEDIVYQVISWPYITYLPICYLDGVKSTCHGRVYRTSLGIHCAFQIQEITFRRERAQWKWQVIRIDSRRTVNMALFLCVLWLAAISIPDLKNRKSFTSHVVSASRTVTQRIEPVQRG